MEARLAVMLCDGTGHPARHRWLFQIAPLPPSSTSLLFLPLVVIVIVIIPVLLFDISLQNFQCIITVHVVFMHNFKHALTNEFTLALSVGWVHI